MQTIGYDNVFVIICVYVLTFLDTNDNLRIFLVSLRNHIYLGNSNPYFVTTVSMKTYVISCKAFSWNTNVWNIYANNNLVWKSNPLMYLNFMLAVLDKSEISRYLVKFSWYYFKVHWLGNRVLIVEQRTRRTETI